MGLEYSGVGKSDDDLAVDEDHVTPGDKLIPQINGENNDDESSSLLVRTTLGFCNGRTRTVSTWDLNNRSWNDITYKKCV